MPGSIPGKGHCVPIVLFLHLSTGDRKNANLRETVSLPLQVVDEWAMGTPFEEISRLTEVMEGSIVRCVVRLDEQCRQLMDAARVMGNTALFQQMEAASAAIKRDVVFAASLYTS